MRLSGSFKGRKCRYADVKWKNNLRLTTKEKNVSRCFSLKSLLLALTLIALPFATVSAKPATSAKTVVKNKAKTSQAAAKSNSTAKKAVTAKKRDKEVAKKVVAPKKGVKKADVSRKASSRKTVSKKAETKSAAKTKSTVGKNATRTSRKRNVAKNNKTPRMRMTTLRAGKKFIRVEVASTEAEHERGLMYRRSLPADSGMLFDFKGPAKTCMWMKDTYIPLSVAFIDVNGKVVNIEEMKARTTTSHCSKDWIRYALEMNAKWFSRNGVRPGSRIKGLPR